MFQLCPINYLRKNRVLYYELPDDHPDLLDLDGFKVAEIVLDFIGAKTTTDNYNLKVGIESSGKFKGRKKDKVYNFLTRPLSLVFEYNLVTGKSSSKEFPKQS